MLAPHLQKKGCWFFKRRVPKAYASLDERAHVLQSTKIRIADDPRAIRAKEVVAEFNTALEAFWEAMLQGLNPDGGAMFKAARAKALRRYR